MHESEVRSAKPTNLSYQLTADSYLRWYWDYWSYIQRFRVWYESVVVNTETGANWYCYEGGLWIEYFNGWYHPGGSGGCVMNPAAFRFELGEASLSFDPPTGFVDINGDYWGCTPCGELPPDLIIETGGVELSAQDLVEIVFPPNVSWPNPPGSTLPNPHIEGKHLTIMGSYIPWWTCVDPIIGFLPHDQPVQIYWMPSGYSAHPFKFEKLGKYIPPPVPEAVLTMLALGCSAFAQVATRRKRI